MIPLIRPQIPSMEEIDRFLAGARATGKWSNFGFAWREAIERLDKETGKYCVLVHNGTSAIELAARFTFKPGSRVLIPDYTHIGTLQAIVQAGMEPILCPVNKRTWTLDVEFIIKHRKSFDAAVVVSPFGYYVDFEAYDALFDEMKKPLIYDLAGAWGMPLHATQNTCTFSLHATKNFSCGEGGIIACGTDKLREKIRVATNFDTLPDRSVASINAGNYKVDEFKSAIVCAHLENKDRLKKRIEQKKRSLQFYEDFLGDLCTLHLLYSHPDSAPSLCVLSGLPANKLESSSHLLGVEAKQYYKLLSSMEHLKDVKRIGVSSSYFETCCALPSDCTDNELDWVVEVLRKFLKG